MTEQQKAKEYNRKKILIDIIDTLLLMIFLSLFMLCGWSIAVKDFLLSFIASTWLLNIVYTMAFFLIIKFISFPLTFYSGYVLEHKYQLATENFFNWIKDELKGLALVLVFGPIMIMIIYGMIRFFPSSWWIISAGIFGLLFILMTKLAPVLLLPIFFKFNQISDPDLEARLSILTTKAKTGINGIFKMDLSRKSRTANAALTGIGKTRRIVLSDTLLEAYTHDEIEVIMAHELGHHRYNHLWKGIVIQSILMFILFFIISRILTKGVFWFYLSGIHDIAGLPFLILISMVFSLIFLPLVNFCLRQMEYQADEYSIFITGKREAFIQALEKLSQQNLCEKEPDPVIEFIFHSHPSISKRIGRLLAYGQNQSTRNG